MPPPLTASPQAAIAYLLMLESARLVPETVLQADFAGRNSDGEGRSPGGGQGRPCQRVDRWQLIKAAHSQELEELSGCPVQGRATD